MNGESYSSRGDGGRHGSSREHYSSRSSRDDHRGGGDRDRTERPRRRSRSPGHRSSRREYPDVDTYSSSRDHREREREDRYRDRRDDRGWDRDRASGGRGDRSDRGRDERPPRRDRDLFDDRDGGRGGRGGPGGGRDGPRGGEKRKSASPPPKPKEPTPDLTDIPSILSKKRRLTQWDIKPPGYENVTAEQAKLSGMFPLPGAPRQQPMDPSRLQAFMNQPAGSVSNAALKPSNAKQSKRLFVHDFPASVDDNSLLDFFNQQLNGLNVVSGIDPCISALITKDRSSALLEFKSPEDATMALTLDGISMEDQPMTNGGTNGNSGGLAIRRPKDYIVPVLTEEEDESVGGISKVVKDSQSKISITNIPIYLTDDQVSELLASFGDLKAFVLVKDTETDQSKGIAFCEYVVAANTTVAVEGLNGMELGDQNLKVQRASIGVMQAVHASGAEMSVGAMSLLAGTVAEDLEQGRVLQLLNMVTAEELMDNDEYAEICADVKEECGRFGKVEEMKVPRPSGGSRQSAGVGKIFVKYDTPESAQKALKALAGRKFADRTVVVTFFGEEYFNLNAW